MSFTNETQDGLPSFANFKYSRTEDRISSTTGAMIRAVSFQDSSSTAAADALVVICCCSSSFPNGDDSIGGGGGSIDDPLIFLLLQVQSVSAIRPVSSDDGSRCRRRRFSSTLERGLLLFWL
jgi:hypothetical protein